MKRFKAYISALLIVSATAMAPAFTGHAAGDDGKNASTTFVKTVIARANETGASVKKLHAVIRQAQELHGQGKKYDSLALVIASTSTNAYNSLLVFKSTIELASTNLQAGDLEAMLVFKSFLEGYYSYKGILHLAGESFGKIYPYKSDQLDALDLVLSHKLVLALLAQEGQAVHKKGGTSFDTSYFVKSVGADKSRVSVNPGLMSSHRFSALMAFPSKELVEDALEFEAHKMNFAKFALNNSHLYSDEKIPNPLPANVDSVLLNIDTHAKAFSDESMVRKWLSPHDFTRLEKAIVAKRDPRYAALVGQRFELLADVLLPDQVQQERLKQYGGTPASLAHRLLMVEQKSGQLATTIHSVVASMPGYVTEMSREGLKTFLYEAAILATSNITLAQLFTGMFDENTLAQTPEDGVVIAAAVTELAEYGLRPEVITDELIDEFQKAINVSRDKAISFARYKMAQNIIAGAEYLESVQETIERVSEQANGYVPVDLIPTQPDPGLVLLAMHQDSSNGKAPIWFTQILKSLGSKTIELKSSVQIRALYDVLHSLPAELRDEVNALRNDATSSALKSLSRFHAELAKDTHYRWSSAEAKMKRIMAVATNQPVRNMMSSLLEIMAVADRVNAPALKEMIEDLFELLTEGKRNENQVRGAAKKLALGDLKIGLDFFAEQINDAETYLAANDTLLQAFFSNNESERNAFLQKQLGKKDAFMGYVKAKLQDLEARLPILFAKVPLWQHGRDMTGNSKPIALGDLVIGLKKAINGLSLDKTLASDSLSFLESDVLKAGEVLSEDDLRQPIEGLAASVTPRRAALYATMGSSPKIDHWRWFMSKVYDRVFDDETPAPPIEDHFWSTEFKVRDALPAHFDSTKSLKSKALKIMVSSLLSVYLQSSATASAEETRVLLAPGKPNTNLPDYLKSSGISAGDDTPNTDQLLKTPIYSALQREAGSAIGGGLKSMHKKAMWRTAFAEDIKKVTGRVHTVTHYIFMSSFLLKFSPTGHAFLGHTMALSSFFDLSADILMYADYWQSYSSMAPFSFSNAMGGGLVTYDEADKMKDEISSMTKVLLNRLPMDLWFFRDVIHGDAKRIEFWNFNRRVNGTLAKSKIDRREFDSDYMKLMQQYQGVGLRVGTTPAQYRELHKALVAEITPRAKQKDEGAVASLKALNNLKKSLDKFEKKYPALVKFLIGPSKGKAGFKDEKDFKQEQKMIKKQRQLRGEE